MISPDAMVVKVIEHLSEARRILIVRRPDGLYTYAEYVRRPVTLDPVTAEITSWPDEPRVRLEGWILETEPDGSPSGYAWFEYQMLAGLFGNAEETEECAVVAVPGYRRLN